MISNIDLSRCSKGFLGRYARRYPNQPFNPIRWASLSPIEENILEKEDVDETKVEYYTGRYVDLRKKGYDEAFQKNKMGIRTRLDRIENELQEHYKAHLDKKPSKYFGDKKIGEQKGIEL